MSEDKSQKTEKPTRKKLRDARKRGQVAQSKEIASTALILTFFLYIAFTWQAQLHRFKEILLLPSDYYDMPFADALALVSNALVYEMLAMVAPFIGIAIVVSVLSSVLQFGFLFAVEPLKPDFNKVNPVEGFKRIFSARNAIELLKSVVKVALLSVVLYYIVRYHINDLLNVLYHDMFSLMDVMTELMSKLLVYLAPALVVIAAVDYVLQKTQFVKEQMMTKEERKREFKETEGDPLVKSTRRQQQRKLASEDVGQRVKTATLIVVDGSRAAAALWYEKGTTPLPMVTLLGKGPSAAHIVKFAHAAEKNIVENGGLAQALLEKTQTDQYIPADLIDEVAAVMRESAGAAA